MAKRPEGIRREGYVEGTAIRTRQIAMAARETAEKAMEGVADLGEIVETHDARLDEHDRKLHEHGEEIGALVKAEEKSRERLDRLEEGSSAGGVSPLTREEQMVHSSKLEAYYRDKAIKEGEEYQRIICEEFRERSGKNVATRLLGPVILALGLGGGGLAYLAIEAIAKAPR